ncbi:MAG: squalene synthase HpnC [Candidimonas sp.]
MPVDHYENFPVASLLLPRRLREPVENIYRFARSADDLADEGDAPPEDRLAALEQYRQALRTIASGAPIPPFDETGLSEVFVPLQASIAAFGLPIRPFEDLLSAFEQDVVKTRYASAQELMDYCRRSANPVGRLMLHLYNVRDETSLAQSDAICSGLQLTNFWQDVAVDWRKDRVYLPRDAMLAHGVDERYIDERGRDCGDASAQGARDPRQDAAWRDLMREQAAHARGLLLRGAPLARRLPGRIGFELRLVVLGGLRILERLDTLHYDMFRHRPTLGKADWLSLLPRALLFTPRLHES